jgi:DNA-binding CsgD family transcriptional regulator
VLVMGGASQLAKSHGDGDLIAAIYDAIIEPSGWDDVVKRIVEATKSDSATLWIQQSDAVHFSATCNIDPFYTDAYVQHYHKINPLSAALRAAPIAPGDVRTATFISQTDSFKASAICNEYFRPQGWADFVAIGLLRAPKAFGNLHLHRSPDAIWVEPAEWQLLETLAPHLQRAAEIHQLLARERAAKDSLGAAVAAAGFAVFLLSGDCRVVFANAKAEDLVRQGMGLRLAATNPTLTARLHALARHGSQPGRGEGDIGGTLELCRGEDHPPLVAHVIPLAANRTVAILDLDRPSAAVFIVDPAAGLGPQIRHFAASFGLTGAETRVLAEIIAGNGLLAAAAKLKITEATARTHAKHVLAKTGTNRQTELIRRFFETALPAAP